jgi:hypothetical protein
MLSNAEIDFDIVEAVYETFKKGSYRALSVTEEDDLDNLILEDLDVYKEQDVIVFKKETMRSGLTDISAMSSYDAVRRHVLKLCCGGELTTSADRIKPELVYEPAKKPKKISDDARIFKCGVYLGCGSLALIKSILDNVRNRYDTIYIAPCPMCLDWVHPGDKVWKDFTDSLVRMYFSEPPYVITEKKDYPPGDMNFLLGRDKFPAVIAPLDKYLCEGKIPNKLKGIEYIVLMTKVRLYKKDLYAKAVKMGLWKKLSALSKRYKIVILGEKQIEYNAEYMNQLDNVYTIYDDIIKYIPKENIIDLSMPAWGKSAPSLSRLKKDMTIIAGAKYSISIGVGGNFVMSACVPSTVTVAVGMPTITDDDLFSKMVFDGKKFFPNLWVSRNIDQFMKIIDNIGIKGAIMPFKTRPLPPLTEYKNAYKVVIKPTTKNILMTRGILDAQTKKYDKVHIAGDYSEMKKENIAYMKSLMELVFTGPFYAVTEADETYRPRTITQLKNVDGFGIVKPFLSDLLCSGKALDKGPYITVSCIVENIERSVYETEIRAKLLSKLNIISRSHNIVLVGARSIDGTKSFSIYDDVMTGVPNNVIDSSNDGVLDIGTFKQDCLYMRDAEWNITLGDGKAPTVASSVGTMIGFSTIMTSEEYPGVYVFDKLNLYFSKLDIIVSDKRPIYKCCVNMGVGDLLLIRSMLDFVKDRYKEVLISPNIPFFDEIRSKNYTKGFIGDYMRLLFKPPYYKITSDLSYPKREGVAIQMQDGIGITGPQHLQDLFCVGKSLDIGPYITLNTKVRIVNKTSYEAFKGRFFDNLNIVAMKYKIVLLGDRKLLKWKEFDMFPADIFVMYDDITRNIPADRIIDLTFPNLEKGTMERVQQDCLYMKEAVYNLFLGGAGSWILGLVSGKCLSYYEPGNVEHHRHYTKVKSTSYLTEDFEKYLYWMRSL